MQTLPVEVGPFVQPHWTPEEVANAIVFVASERASWVSGVTLLVDGVQHKGIY